MLNAPTARERSIVEKVCVHVFVVDDRVLTMLQFQSKGGSAVREFCPFGTKEDCKRERKSSTACQHKHFRRIILPHTDLSMGTAH